MSAGGIRVVQATAWYPPYDTGGTETYLEGLIGALRALGVESSVLVPRRAGAAILVAWCGLWLGNAIYFAWIDAYFRPVWLAIAAMVAAFLTCTVAWAARRW